MRCQHAPNPVVIDICLYTEGRQAIITVKDNGPGIPSALEDQVFEPFFTQAREQGGTGLGLAVVRALVNAHQGNIRLLPEVSGAGFELSLPY